jgi:hypothetical protein
MNPVPSPHRPHWIPVEPSWIVALGLVTLAVLPHQVPRAGRLILQHPIGAILFAVLSAWVATKIPVLGAAMLIFLACVWLSASAGGVKDIEGFSPIILNKDSVQKTPEQKKPTRWLNEEILSEIPDAIQERTDNTYLNYDAVTEQESGTWSAEDILGETPTGIQERVIANEPDYDDSGASFGSSHR